jgi:hypothetical protein
VVLVALVAGVLRHRRVAPPAAVAVEPEPAASPAGDLDQLAAEARRDFG